MGDDWTDHLGTIRRVPTTVSSLSFSSVPGHRALRAFVFTRDGFTCNHCAASAGFPATPYDGSFAPRTNNESFLVVDHVVSRRNGGSHHPSNLQTLCDRCNARKSSLVDARAKLPVEHV